MFPHHPGAMMRHAGVVLLVLTLASCGTTSASRQVVSSDVLTRAEIQASRAPNAYELLQQLRPQFLRSRGALNVSDAAAGYAVVYVNDVHHGDLDSLRAIRIGEIEEIRYIGATDATTRWGTGHTGGVIQVRVRY